MSGKELSKTEISSLPDKEFKTIVLKMLTELGRRMDELSENFSKQIENIKNNQLKLKNTIIKMKNIVEKINSRLEDGSAIEKTWWWKSPNQSRKRKFFLNKDSLRDPWDNIKLTNIYIMGVKR